MKLSTFALFLSCVSMAAACTTVIHNNDGGSGGQGLSSVNGNVVVGNVTSGGSSCDAAANSIESKFKSCGLDTTTGTTTASTGTMDSCTTAAAAELQAEAACVANASCDAITGKDVAAQTTFVDCLQAAIPPTTASTTATVGSGNPTTSGGGTCANPDSPQDCASCTSSAACTTSGDTPECCENAVPGGIDAYDTALINGCACTSGTTCHTACGGASDICADPNAQPSQACVTCLNAITATDACVTNFQNACAASQDCTSYLTCVQSCP